MTPPELLGVHMSKFSHLLQVFKPPNPWTMSIMNVLAELHQEPDLKLNLKFEIEVLCKNLNVDVVVSNVTARCKLHLPSGCSVMAPVNVHGQVVASVTVSHYRLILCHHTQSSALAGCKLHLKVLC